jgi:cell division protein FtsA
MDTRIGYPNEHLAGNSSPEIASPMYATAVGLLMGALEIQEIQAKTKPEIEQQDTDDTPAQENEASNEPKKGGLLGIFLNKAKNIFDELAD